MIARCERCGSSAVRFIPDPIGRTVETCERRRGGCGRTVTISWRRPGDVLDTLESEHAAFVARVRNEERAAREAEPKRRCQVSVSAMHPDAYRFRILAAVQAAGDEGLSAQELMAVMAVSSEWARPKLSRLSRDGLITRGVRRAYGENRKQVTVWVAVDRASEAA